MKNKSNKTNKPGVTDALRKKLVGLFESKIVGQRRIVTNLIDNLLSYANGGILLSPFFSGTAGLGKTALLNAWHQGMELTCESIGKNLVALRYNSPSEFRQSGEFNDINDVMAGRNSASAPVLFSVDEAHEFKERPTVSMDYCYRGIKTILGSAGVEKSMVAAKINDDLTWHASKTNFSCSMATNFMHKLKDREAITSRFNFFTLELLSQDDLGKILVMMLAGRSIKGCEGTLKAIAACGRGTARPMQRVVDKLEEYAVISGKHTVNKDDAYNAMLSLRLFPQGLNETDVNLLLAIAKHDRTRTELKLEFALESKAVAETVAFLSSRELVATTDSKVLLTRKGADYLNGIRKLGFID